MKDFTISDLISTPLTHLQTEIQQAFQHYEEKEKET